MPACPLITVMHFAIVAIYGHLLWWLDSKAARPWTSEVIQMLHGHLPAAQIVATMLKKFTECDHRSRPWQILCTSSLIPLKKSEQGGVRPKLASSITASQCLAESLPVFEGMQYGIGTPNGCVKVAKGVQQYMEQHPEAVIAQLDLSNAFGSVGVLAANGRPGLQIEQVHQALCMTVTRMCMLCIPDLVKSSPMSSCLFS